MPPLQRRFGKALRGRREAAHLSQEALASAAGLHRNYVGLLERGQRMPTLGVADKLARALGMRLSELIVDVESTR